MEIVFRVDSSYVIGTGHLMRCLTLAEALREHGANCIFICRDYPRNIYSLIQEKGFPLYLLERTENATPDNWLGITQEEDAQQTISILKELDITPDWLIVDNYFIDITWEQQLREHVKKIMVIDDLANRPHNCDILLDQNLCPEFANRYDDLIPSSCIRLLGIEYLMLRSEFLTSNKKVNHPQFANNILISMGGSDNQNVTGWLLDIFNQIYTRFSIKIVVGRACPHYADIASKASKMHLHDLTVYESVTRISKVMLWADMAICAGGFTTYELAFLGVPTLVITSSSTQVEVANFLHQLNMTWFIGEFGNVPTYEVNKAVILLASDQKSRIKLSQVMQSKINGLGVHNVLKKLVGG